MGRGLTDGEEGGSDIDMDGGRESELRLMGTEEGSALRLLLDPKPRIP